MQNFGRQIRYIMGDVQVAYVQSCYFVIAIVIAIITA